MLVKYKNNIGEYFTLEDQKTLLSKTFAVLGCGGQGGYITEFLVRLGVKKIYLFDGDVFEESNLNRQNGAEINNLGLNKAEVVALKCISINPDIEIVPINHFFGEMITDKDIILSVDFIFDEMDYGIKIKNCREFLREALLNDIPITNGGNTLFGSTISILNKKSLYLFDKESFEIQNTKQNTKKIAQPAYQCAITAGLEINAMIDYLLKRKNLLNFPQNFDFIKNI